MKSPRRRSQIWDSRQSPSRGGQWGIITIPRSATRILIHLMSRCTTLRSCMCARALASCRPKSLTTSSCTILCVCMNDQIFLSCLLGAKKSVGRLHESMVAWFVHEEFTGGWALASFQESIRDRRVPWMQKGFDQIATRKALQDSWCMYVCRMYLYTCTLCALQQRKNQRMQVIEEWCG